MAALRRGKQRTNDEKLHMSAGHNKRKWQQMALYEEQNRRISARSPAQKVGQVVKYVKVRGARQKVARWPKETHAEQVLKQLSKRDKDEILQHVDSNAHPKEGAYLTRASFVEYMRRCFNVSLTPSQGAELLNALGRTYDVTTIGSYAERAAKEETKDHRSRFLPLLEMLHEDGRFCIAYHDESQMRVNTCPGKAWIPKLKRGERRLWESVSANCARAHVPPP
ncbi:MAG: hypothetical protein H0U56_10810 [Methylibium sp.]|nr:hypothetical protein [Methylibium sp.]